MKSFKSVGSDKEMLDYLRDLTYRDAWLLGSADHRRHCHEPWKECIHGDSLVSNAELADGGSIQFVERQHNLGG